MKWIWISALLLSASALHLPGLSTEDTYDHSNPYTLKQEKATSTELYSKPKDLKTTQWNLEREFELFSRTFDESHYQNAMALFHKLRKNGQKVQIPKVNTY